MHVVAYNTTYVLRVPGGLVVVTYAQYSAIQGDVYDFLIKLVHG